MSVFAIGVVMADGSEWRKRECDRLPLAVGVDRGRFVDVVVAVRERVVEGEARVSSRVGGSGS